MPPQNQRPPENPQDNWPVTKDDKVQIQALGRDLHKFLNNHFNGKEAVHVKIVVGAFNYIMDLQSQRTKLVGDDFLIAQRSVAAAKLEDKIEEPFEVEPDLPEPTIEERRAQLNAQLAELDTEEVGEEVADASPSPSDSAEPTVDGPAPEVVPVTTPEAAVATATAPTTPEAPKAPETPATPAG